MLLRQCPVQCRYNNSSPLWHFYLEAGKYAMVNSCIARSSVVTLVGVEYQFAVAL